ncbi:hypothetical protein F909_00723 [Acinetobacter sp. ANC 3929]|uniref:hypothetical protein n=1 Tax=unclassified Acinetobacter TaxID=196816 RepID=UPI0002D0C6CB|nr:MULTISPECIES: hypothetical protein [unclassified Acinetobacter]ENW83131.1 hypothetical protein F909_00723 [Acinetobacter sp. ANC 3929]MCH7351245.1 antibiotic biosynthesis monooxygenase [Acinetobacter sp. NIPH 2023]MCH7357346.1 antibiotic biosynthesis monooxygenase [Acinetobacter sp. NIPH 1958]MCH7359098.1 antibiotic biosynthesis monooxygenase [Acinetobacter sp. NIPH 2024]
MSHILTSTQFQSEPTPTVFVVNVIHAHPEKQEQAFKIIQEIVHYASFKEGFLWSNLAKSLDGKTVVNIEAISSKDDVKKFFGDKVFEAKFDRLKAVADFEFHIYQSDDVVFPHSGIVHKLQDTPA